MGLKVVSQQLAIAASMTVLILSFQNCSPNAGLTASTSDSLTSSSISQSVSESDDSTVTTDEPNSVKDTDVESDSEASVEAYKGICSFLNELEPVSETETLESDITFKLGVRGQQSITPNFNEETLIESANNIKIEGFLGALKILKAKTVEQLSIKSKSLKVNAYEVKQLQVIGKACIQAVKADQIQVRGKAKIIGESINSLEMQGLVHLFGAKVDFVSGVGTVCLHEGAHITSFSGQINIKECE